MVFVICLRNPIGMALCLIAVLLMVGSVSNAFPVLTSVHAITYETFNVGVAGSGKVHWSSSYDQAYDTGWVGNCASIAIAKGATVTFTAVPMNGNHFNEWMVDSANQGSNNPYVVHSMYVSQPTSVVAVFTQR